MNARKELAKLGCLLFVCCIPYGIVGCMNQHDAAVVEPDPAPVVEEELPEPEPEPVIAPEPEPTPEPDPDPEPTPEAEPEPTYTQEDLEMLAITIYREAGADYIADSTRQMVGEVVLNRVASEYFPNTIYEVLTAPYQYGRFAWTGVVWPERAGYECETHAVARAYECAEALLSGSVERLLPEDTIWQAEFTQGAETVAFVDGIYFCR